MANRFILWSVCFWCDRRIARICLWCCYCCCSCSYLSTIVCGLSRDHVANKCYQIFYLFGCMKKTCVHRIAEISMSERSDKKKMKSYSALRLEWMKQTGHSRREYTFALFGSFLFSRWHYDTIRVSSEICARVHLHFSFLAVRWASASISQQHIYGI